MINIRRWLNEKYIYNTLNKKNFFYITLIVLSIVFFKYTTIIWWITLVSFLWIASKIYNLKKKHIDEEELDNYCIQGSVDPRCDMYKNAKQNYNNLINTISKTL
jgi:hypothetical protein